MPQNSSDTVSFLRPLARRAASTRRPLAVDMRLRKPCLLRRLRTEGWYVLFIDPLPYWGGRIALHRGTPQGPTIPVSISGRKGSTFAQKSPSPTPSLPEQRGTKSVFPRRNWDLIRRCRSVGRVDLHNKMSPDCGQSCAGSGDGMGILASFANFAAGESIRLGMGQAKGVHS